MHLIELGDLFEKLSGMGSESTVVEHRVPWETKSIHILWWWCVCGGGGGIHIHVHTTCIFL